MKQFMDLTDDEKREYLNKIVDKEVSMVYTESDLPNGAIGPERIVGKITSVQLTSFNFEFGLTSETAPLTIGGIEEIEVIK